MSVEIYTEEFCEKELKNMLETIRGDKEIITLWQLLETKDYARQRVSEWPWKYPDNKNIKDYLDTIRWIIESRKQVWALTGKLNATFTIFDMKNNHGWVDKQEIDQTSRNINLDKDISDLSDDELQKILKG